MGEKDERHAQAAAMPELRIVGDMDTKKTEAGYCDCGRISKRKSAKPPRISEEEIQRVAEDIYDEYSYDSPKMTVSGIAAILRTLNEKPNV